MAKTRESMASEFLRDAAVLLLVFAMLDKVVVRGHSIWWTIGVTSLILAISAVLYRLGVRMEEMQLPIEETEEDDD